jgi:hypothetical protein
LEEINNFASCKKTGVNAVYLVRRIDTFFLDTYLIAVAIICLIALKNGRKNKMERLNQHYYNVRNKDTLRKDTEFLILSPPEEKVFNYLNAFAAFIADFVPIAVIARLTLQSNEKEIANHREFIIKAESRI